MARDAVHAVSKPDRPARRGYRLILPLLLVLLAFLLRVYHLDFQSLWSDEGISLLRSSQPLGQMLRQMPVEHVPGYFVLLNLWLPLAGASDFALRWPSLIPSVLVVALAYRVGADLGSRRAGAAAALLLGTGMFQVWYGQEARMYSWLLAAGFGSTWFLWRMLPQAGRGGRAGSEPAPGPRRPAAATVWPAWIGYVLCTAGAVYMHMYGFLLPAAQTAFMLLWLALTRDRRGFARWVAAGAAVLLLYLPWLGRSLGIFGFPGWRLGLDPLALPWRYLAAYTAGDAMPAPWHAWLPWLYLALALLGAWAWWRQARLAALLLCCVTALPFAGAFALALRQPDYHERYTIFISAPLVLLAARGLWPFATNAGPAGHALRRSLRYVLPAALLAGLAAANSAALYRLYTDPAAQKADYKTPIHRIEQNGQPGDVILLDGPEPQQIFLHYYRGGLPWLDLRPLANSSDAGTAAALQAATDGKRRAWVLRHYHDEGPVQAWLARNAWPADQTYYSGLYLNTYGLPALVTTTLPAGQAFGPGLKLVGAGLAGGKATGDKVEAQAGDLLGVTTAWQAAEALPPLKFSLRLQDQAGRRWAAEDYVPQAGFAPTEGWRPGESVTDRHALWLPPDLPPGRYEVALVLYDPATGWALETGHSPALGAVEVRPAARPPDPGSLSIPVRLDGKSLNPELALLGYGLAPQPLRAGQDARLRVWWQARARPAQAYQLLVELSDGRGQFAARKLYPLSAAPADTWEEGQVLRAEYALEFNPAAPSGAYRLNLTLAGADGKPLGPPLAAGATSFAARARSYRLPQISHAVDARLGEDIALRGYDLSLPQAAAGDVVLTLVWQATAPEHAAYKVFVHLLDAQGQVVAQSDAVPAGGAAPTESWLADEVVIDAHRLAAPKPGRYRLLVGLYDPNTGQRPAARDRAGQAIPDGAIPLAEFEAP